MHDGKLSPVEEERLLETNDNDIKPIMTRMQIFFGIPLTLVTIFFTIHLFVTGLKESNKRTQSPPNTMINKNTPAADPVPSQNDTTADSIPL